MTEPTPAKLVLDLVIFDRPDAVALGTFYGAILGWGIEDGSTVDWTTLVPPGGGVSPENPDGRPTLAFQRVDDYQRPTWPGGAHPQQGHLDLWAGDIDAAEPAVLAAGATVHEHQPSERRTFRVSVDPPVIPSA